MASLRSIPNGESHSPRRCDTNAGPKSPGSNDQTVSVTSVVRIETAKSEMPGIGVFPKGPCLRAIQAVGCDRLTQVAKLRQFARVPHRGCKNYKTPGKSAQRLLRRIVEGGYTPPSLPGRSDPCVSRRPLGHPLPPRLSLFSFCRPSLRSIPPRFSLPDLSSGSWSLGLASPPLWGDAPPGSP